MKTRWQIGWGVCLALFLMSCDPILETIYPEFKNSYASQKGRGITVNVAVDGGLYASLTPGTPVSIKLVPFNKTEDGFRVDIGNVKDRMIFKSELSGTLNKAVFFGDLYNAYWAAFVYVEENGNNQIDYDEVSVLGLIDGVPGKDKADFRFEVKSVTMNADLYSYSKIEGWILDQLQGYNPGGGGGTNPPVAEIGDFPPFVGVGQGVSFQSTSYDPDGYIKTWIWTVLEEQQNGTTVQEAQFFRFDNGPLTFAFPRPGIFLVRLGVEDNTGMRETTPAEVRVTVDDTFVQQTIQISGSSPYPDFSQQTRFVLIRKDNLKWELNIDTYSNVFSNVFNNVPQGEWLVLAWVDLNGNGNVDAGEPGKIATNLTSTIDEVNIGGTNYDLVRFVGYSTVYVEANILLTDVVPSAFTSSAPSGEAANNTLYRLQVDLQSMNGAWNGKNLLFRINTPNGTPYLGLNTLYYSGLTLTGSLLTINDLTGWDLQYHPVPGQDKLVVVVDMNGDGFINTGDLRATKLIFLPSGGATVATVPFTGPEFSLVP